MAYALRRTSARVVVAVGAGGMVLVVFRALRPIRMPVSPFGAAGHGDVAPIADFIRFLGSSPWDLAAASLGVVVAALVGAALFRSSPTRR
jgi:hypothetical protein